MKKTKSSSCNWILLMLMAGTLSCTDGTKSNLSNQDNQKAETIPEDETPIATEVINPLPFANPPEAEDLDPASNQFKTVLRADLKRFKIHDKWVDGYAYNGHFPGPTIRVKRGDTLTIDFKNDLSNPSTIHWHGLHVPFDMDGVTWQGAPIGAGESYTYSFTLNQTGTYWYHPHFDTHHQVDLGLYGLLIVEDPDEPLPTQELLWIFDSWEEEIDRRAVHDHSMIDGAKLLWTVNGSLNPSIAVESGSVIRARMVNVSNAGYLKLSWPNIRHIGSDQGLLPQLATPHHILLAPGDRADVELLVGQTTIEIMNSPYTLHGGNTNQPTTSIITLAPTGELAAPHGLSWPFTNTAKTDDPGYTDWVYTFHGNPRTSQWMINGEQFPNVSIRDFNQDDVVILEVRNLSPTDHPFHLHGHGFEVLSQNGQEPPYRMMEDNINIGVRQALRLRLVANNPGDWMTHCHILPHAHGGMMTVLRVNEP